MFLECFQFLLELLIFSLELCKELGINVLLVRDFAEILLRQIVNCLSLGFRGIIDLNKVVRLHAFQMRGTHYLDYV